MENPVIGSKKQKKISAYFSNRPKDDTLGDDKNMVEKATKSIPLITIYDKNNKRKTYDDLESERYKVSKHDDSPDEHNSKISQLEVQKPTLVCDIFEKGSGNLKNSPKKTKDNKENLGNNICEGTVEASGSDKKSSKTEHAESSKSVLEVDVITFSDSSPDSYFVEDFSEYFTEDFSVDPEVDFSKYERCKVVDAKVVNNVMLLSVMSEERDNKSETIKCSGYWTGCTIKKGDIVIVHAIRDNSEWVVDNMRGLLVVNPDVLISGTTIAAGSFCKRKAVLTERFRKIEHLPYQQGNQTALVIGSLTHELIQKAILEKVSDLDGVNGIMEKMLRNRGTISMLYESEITIDECRNQLLPYVSRICEFIEHYINGISQKAICNNKGNFQGNITEVRDIEETIWLPKLGIKGKIDVTAEVQIHSRKKVMPIEVKTGNPTFSLEHRGQVALYVMLMALTGQGTDTGLLLYLRENFMQEMSSGHVEKRDLILTRNTIANSLKGLSMDQIMKISSRSDLPVMDLPEPINHHSACSKCTYNTLCCAYLSKDKTLDLPENHPLMIICTQMFEKIKRAHIDYMLLWFGLLELEEVAQTSDNKLRNLWTMSPAEREAKRTCISCLKVTGKVTVKDRKYKHSFARINAVRNTGNTEFSENEYILVSTDTRVNISAGFIVNIKKHFLTVLLDRDITQRYGREPFHIDKYSSSSLFSINLANVGGLIGDDEICERLRDIVIDRKPATFQEGVSRSLIEESVKYTKNLNKNQQRAVLKAMSMNDYLLIKGMPGTGKTQTLLALIQLLNETNHSVLITAHTNSAVDNILLKLLDKGIDFLRLGSSVHPLLKHKAEGYTLSHCESPEQMAAIYANKKIIGVTCYGAHHPLLGKRTFDVCVVDESAQALQPTVLRPLYNASKFVLVGDPDQLPPIIKSAQARKLGADESLFARLDNENNTIVLTQQYRMNKNIMYLANKLTYDDKMEAGDTTIANATLVAPYSEEFLPKEAKWLQKTLSRDINDSVVVLNTGRTCKLKSNVSFDSKFEVSDQGNLNIWEGAIVLKLTTLLAQMGVEYQDIGIIAPYRAQVNLLRKIVCKDVEVNTVDQYQGRDKEVIIYSCTKSLVKDAKINESLEVLGDHRRLTVATTRAKRKLIIIGDKSTISRYSAFKKLFELIEDENVINLNDQDVDFSWKDVVSLLS